VKPAIRNAGWLSEILREALVESIRVEPIFTLPGWWIDREAMGQVAVLIHREFRQCIVKRGLSQKQMRQSAYQIEQRCRLKIYRWSRQSRATRNQIGS
jgi:hypothetical protein